LTAILILKLKFGVPMSNYYTYAYLREDRTPYYIGRGKGRRAYCQNHTVPPPPKDRILILKTGLTYAESVQHEVYMIAIFGRKDNGTGILRNLTDGGEGTVGFKFTEEQINHRRKIQTGRRASDEHRQNISNGLKNRWKNGHNNNARRGPRPKSSRPGEKHHCSKITDEQRREIHREYVPGNRRLGGGNAQYLAEKFGISRKTVTAIARDPRWTS
jgi:hypothetical protein